MPLNPWTPLHHKRRNKRAVRRKRSHHGYACEYHAMRRDYATLCEQSEREIDYEEFTRVWRELSPMREQLEPEDHDRLLRIFLTIPELEVDEDGEGE
jgi:hypothetical protein